MTYIEYVRRELEEARARGAAPNQMIGGIDWLSLFEELALLQRDNADDVERPRDDDDRQE